jgi:nucleotide-binding universal stress UspA family protein
MIFKHLLVPLDGSALAEKALPSAMALANRFESELTLLRVIPPPYVTTRVGGGAYGDLIVNLRRMAFDEAQAYLRAQQGSLRQQGFKAHIHLLEGEAVAELILNVIESLDVDTVVMSTHGRSGLSRWVFGSVADKVLRRANVPILLVRATAEQPA